MDSQLVGVLSQRIERLERQNRRIVSLSVLLLSAIAAIFVMGQSSPPGTIRAKTFQLVDDDGRVMASLQSVNIVGGTPGFHPTLLMYDTDGKRIMSSFGWDLGVDAPGLRVGGPGGYIYFRSDGVARLTVAGQPGAGQAEMGVLPDGTSSVWLNDSSGNAQAIMQLQTNRSPQIMLLGGNSVLWSAP